MELKYFDKSKINSEFPDAYMIPPMLAWKLPKNKQNMRQEVLQNEEYFAEVKIDGSCYIFEHTSQGNTYLFSRTVSRKNGLLVEKSDRVPHIVNHLKEILPKGTVIALEIYKPGGKSKDVTSIMGCLAAKAVKRQEKDGYLKALVHDVLIYENVDYMQCGARDRIRRLYHIFDNNNYNNEILSPVKIVENKEYEDFLSECLRDGYEGIILKHKNSKYHPGKRPAWSWIKFKPEEEFDVFSMGFEPPTKEYTGTTDLDKWEYWEDNIPVTKSYAKGWIGSVIIGCYKNGEVYRIGTVASGLTEKVLEQIKNNPYDFMNKPLKVKAMETTSDNRLREPKFIEFREDINLEDCNFEKIFT